MIRKATFILFCSISAVLCWNSSFAANVPPEFIGVWSIASDTENKCSKGDWEKHESDGLISIAPGVIEYWEASCKIVNVRKTHESTAEVSLACGGEGMAWRSNELWYVQKVGARKQFVAVSLARTDERDESGKRVRNPEKHKMSVSIYLACR